MHRLYALLLWACIAAGASPRPAVASDDLTSKQVAPAPSFSFTGSFSRDTDQQEVLFTMQDQGVVVLRTFSYAGGMNGAGTAIPRGGFDPTLSLFDSSGRLVASNEDGGCAVVEPDAVTGLCWDSYLSLPLPAGNYRLVLTQSTNTANGPTLADSFRKVCSAANQSAGNCTQNFTPNPPGFPVGFWDQSRNQRNGSYAVDVAGALATSAPSITSPAMLPGGTAGQAYGFTLTAQPAGNYAWSVLAGSLPPGLTLDPGTGILSGTPSMPGQYTFTVQITDARGPVATSLLTLLVSGLGAPLSAVGGALAGGTVFLPYSQMLSSTGGTGPDTWTLIAGALPNGLSLSGSMVSGTPSRAGGFTFTARVTDSAGAFVSAVFTILIAPQPLAISGLMVPNGISGSDYPLQILTGSGGTPPYTFTAAGTLPPGISFSNGQLSGIPASSGTFPITITMTDSGTPPDSVASVMQIVVSPPNADLILSAASVSFALTTAASGMPAPRNVTVRSSDVQQLLNYSVTAAPGAAWLDVTGGGATTPGSITMSLDPSASSLLSAAAPLTTSVTVTCLAPSPCAGKAQTIQVSVLVSAPSPELAFTSSLVEFSTTASGTASPWQSIGLQNIGAGSAAITSITAADSWLTITGVPAAVAGGPAVSLIFTANPVRLGAGFFRTVVTANSPAGSVTVPVTFSISAAPTLVLSTKGAQYQSTLGSPPGNIHGSFELSLEGGASAGWTAAVLPGSSWLSLNAGSGSGSVDPSHPAAIHYTIDPVGAAALRPAGTFYGTIQVTAVGATNSPQSFQVIVNVAGAVSPAIPDPEPGGLIFTSVVGAAAPSSQNMTVYSSSAIPTAYAASAATLSGGAWLAVASGVGTSSASNPGISTILVNPGALAAGVYRGNISYQFSAAAVRTVNVTMIIAPSGAGCTPTQVVPTQIGPVTNFSQAIALPTPLSVRILQDCGGAIANAQVVATFSNGDPPIELTLADPLSGLYSGTWTPRSISPQVTVTATVTASGLSSGATQITGQVFASLAPLLTLGGAVHIYDPLLGGAVAPGTIIAIYGSNLAPLAVPNTSASLPMTLGGTSVTIGGIPAALYYVSPSQIDAQVPLELVPGDQYQIVVESAGAFSTAGSIHVIAAAPGIAAFPDGQIIAQHLDYSLVTPESPAHPGEYVIIYLAGMGLTDSSLADGAPSPSDPLAVPLIAPVLTLNGVVVQGAFTCLSPGFAGLFQMSFQIPANAPTGNVQLVVSQSGVPSNLTILPIQ